MLIDILMKSIFVFVKHNNKQSQFEGKFESSIHPRYRSFYLFKIVYSTSVLPLYCQRLNLRNVSLELRVFREYGVWSQDCDGCCSDHNTGSDPPPHARGSRPVTSHRKKLPSRHSGHSLHSSHRLSDFLVCIRHSLPVCCDL